jgi:hypothetical protein
VYAETISAILKIATVGPQQADGRGTIKQAPQKKALAINPLPRLYFLILRFLRQEAPNQKSALKQAETPFRAYNNVLRAHQ